MVKRLLEDGIKKLRNFFFELKFPSEKMRVDTAEILNRECVTVSQIIQREIAAARQVRVSGPLTAVGPPAGGDRDRD